MHFLGGKAALGKAKFVELAVISSSFLAVLEDAGALIEGCAEVEFDRTEFEDAFGGCRQWSELEGLPWPKYLMFLTLET